MEKAHKYRHLIDNSSKFSLADTAETERETIVKVEDFSNSGRFFNFSEDKVKGNTDSDKGNKRRLHHS